MPVLFVITNMLAILYAVHYYLHSIVLKYDLQNILIDVSKTYMATIMFKSTCETQTHLCHHFLEHLVSQTHLCLAQKALWKVLFSLGGNTPSAQFLFYICHVQRPLRNLSAQFLGRKKWHSGCIRKIIS